MKALQIDGQKIKFDREWHLVEKETLVVLWHQTEKELAHFSTEFDGTTLVFKNKKHGSKVEIDTRKHPEDFEKPQPCAARGKLGYAESDEVNTWFSKCLNRQVILVRAQKQEVGYQMNLDDTPQANIEKDRIYNFVSTAPLSVCSQASVEDLKQKVEVIHGKNWRDTIQVDHQSFRMNMIVDTKYPFSEERFLKGKINEDVDIEFVGTDARCVQITCNHQKKDET